jgi:hypothetical protein
MTGLVCRLHATNRKGVVRGECHGNVDLSSSILPFHSLTFIKHLMANLSLWHMVVVNMQDILLLHRSPERILVIWGKDVSTECNIELLGRTCSYTT